MSKLTTGAQMPDFLVDTLTARGIRISEITGGKPTVLMVLRYIGCPVCRYDVHLLSQRCEEFREKGANVAVVMQSKPETVRRDLAGQELPFPLICDPDLKLYRALDVQPAANLQALLGDSLPLLQKKGAAAETLGFTHGEYEGIEEQLPAFFLLDSDLTVREARYAQNLMDMPTIDEILEKL